MDVNETPLKVSDFVPSRNDLGGHGAHMEDPLSVSTSATIKTNSHHKRVSIAADFTPSGVETPSENDPPPTQASTCSTSWTGVEKDSRSAWLACIAAYCIQIFVAGQLHVYGIFFAALLDDLQCSKGEAAWVGSMAYGLTMLLAPLSSVVINNWGSHVSVIIGSTICTLSLIVSSYAPNVNVLFFTFSGLYGLGNALAYQPTMTIAGDYFEKYLTVALGIMVAGTSTGTVVLSPITQALIDSLGWRGAMRVMSIFAASGVLSGYVFKPKGKRPHNPIRDIKKSPARRLIKDLHLWKNRAYLLWVIGITLAMFGYYIPYVHLVSHCKDLGISADSASLLMMVLGGSTGIGRIMFGKIVDMGLMDRLHMHQLSLLITGTGAMILPLITAYWGLMIYVICAGLVDGCMVVLLPVLTTTLIGAENKVTAWGYLTCVSAITFTLGPPTAGWLYDVTGSYNIAFHIAGVPIILGAVIFFFIPWAQRTANSTNAMTAAQSYMIMSAPLQSEDEMSIMSSHSDHTTHMVTSSELDEDTVFTQEVVKPTSTMTSSVTQSAMIEFSPTETSPDKVKDVLQGAAQILSASELQHNDTISRTSCLSETPGGCSSLSIASNTSMNSGSIVRQRPRPSCSQLNSPMHPLSGIMSPQISQTGDLDIEVDDLMSIQIHTPATTSILEDAIKELSESPLSANLSINSHTRSRTTSIDTSVPPSHSTPRSRTISCNDNHSHLATTPLSGLDVMFHNSMSSNMAGSPLDDFVHVAPGFALSSGQAPMMTGVTSHNSMMSSHHHQRVHASPSDPDTVPHSHSRSTDGPRNVTSDEMIFGVPSIHE